MKYEDIAPDLEKIDSPEKLHAEISRLESLVAQGSGKACFALSFFCGGEINMPLVLTQPPLPEERGWELLTQGYPLLMQEAEQGDGEAMTLIAIYYQAGWPPVECDMRKFYEWNEKAFNAGYGYSAIELYYYYSGPSSPDAERAEFYRKACLEVGHDPDYVQRAKSRWEDLELQEEGMKITQKLNWERAMQIIATGFLFCVVVTIYLFSATYWDDYKEEYLIYNYILELPTARFPYLENHTVAVGRARLSFLNESF